MHFSHFSPYCRPYLLLVSQTEQSAEKGSDRSSQEKASVLYVKLVGLVEVKAMEPPSQPLLHLMKCVESLAA